MNKITALWLLAFATPCIVFAQRAKTRPIPSQVPAGDASEMRVTWPGKASVPAAENPFNLPPLEFKTMPALTNKSSVSTYPIRTEYGENGLPVFFTGKTIVSENAAEDKPVAERAMAYWASLQAPGIREPEKEWISRAAGQDEAGNWHVRLEQQFMGVPVFGGEVIAHTSKGIFQSLNGRYFPTPALKSVTPGVVSTQAIEAVKDHIGRDKVKNNWSDADLKLIGGNEPFSAKLIVYHHNDDLHGEQLAWHITARPNLMSRLVYFVDAQNGSIIHFYDYTCRIFGHHHASCSHSPASTSTPNSPTLPSENIATGPVTASGLDLLNQNRTFGAWMTAGGAIVMEDASKPMFNAQASKMPDEPVGAIVTLDALNTSPEKQSTFNYNFITSSSLTFNNRAGVSAHYNSIKSHDYFRTKFSRNSIDGSGGNIISFVNVSEGDGSSMENAFWNGDAMWYGNGGQVFTPLAGSLDVGGHEMTHGVIEKTANLIYMNESGALNESFADIFGVMIENDGGWKIGEDIIRPGVSPNGCLRDMQNPNNASQPGSQWWQPRTYSERYTGTQDNGGVHINSGITNYAYYLFASNAAVGLARAEQVYYKALRDYLTKSSKFIDCRLAIIRAATDLYGANVANVAAGAFDAVGIGSSGGNQQGGNYLGNLAVNPGNDYVLCSPVSYSRIDLANGSGTILGAIYNQNIVSRPSMRDNGTEYVVINGEGHIVGGTLIYAPNGNITPQADILSDQPVWRNAAISKDGRYIAAVRKQEENIVFVFDLLSNVSRAYELYNPTYSQTGNRTGGVRYADVLEFDYSGEYIMYDAFNQIANTVGDTISYWDIGFLRFRQNGQLLQPANAAISKLFNGVPENTSVGNPVFSKNSPYIVAFDFFGDLAGNGEEQYDILGVNTETGDNDRLIENNGDLGFPNFTRLDNSVIYEGVSNNNAYNIYRRSIENNKITGTGNETQFISNRVWGVWFANGTRGLNVVNAQEAGSNTLDLSVTPNPADEMVFVRFSAPQAAPARCTLSNLMGQVLVTRNMDAVEGINNLDVELQSLPSGTYLLRIECGAGAGTIKLVKN
jgi:bacillolysin